MKILETQNAVLSNIEARVHIEDVEARYKKKQQYNSKKPGPFAGIKLSLEDTLEYLTWTPVAPASCSPALSRSNPGQLIQTLMPHLSKYGLTKAEKLMILNLRPTDREQLETIIEDCDERFGEDTEALEALVEIVRKGFEGELSARVNGNN